MAKAQPKKASSPKAAARRSEAGRGRVFVYPGTFDPVTLGHLDIIGRGAELCDRLVVGVAHGGGSGKAPLFPAKERAAMLVHEIRNMGLQDVVKVEIFDSLLIDFLKALGANTVLRGLRGAADFEYEMGMAAANAVLYENCETIFLRSHPGATFVSSTLVRDIARHRGDLSALVPVAVEAKLRKLFK